MLFTFPSRYLCTIGRRGVFSLGSWSTQIPTGFHVSRGTRVPARSRLLFVYRTVTFSGEPFRTLRLNDRFVTPYERAPQPRMTEVTRFGLFRVRSPLLTESRLISLPRGTEMVHFPRFALSSLCIQLVVTRHDSGGVAPFGNPRI